VLEKRPVLPLVFAAAAVGAVAIPTGAPSAPDDSNIPSKIRAGIVLGVSLGGGVAGASGYPNDSTKIGNPAYYSASGPMFGSSATVLLMGALSDYVNCGFWFDHAEYRNGDWRSDGNAGGLRVDVFPFIRLYSRLDGLALFAKFGIGGGNLVSSMTGTSDSSGTQSFVGTGAFYEWSFWKALGGHFGVGPSLEYDAIWSPAFERHGLVATARLVFYGGP
jgi:hypothetical protein